VKLDLESEVRVGRVIVKSFEASALFERYRRLPVPCEEPILFSTLFPELCLPFISLQSGLPPYTAMARCIVVPST